MKRLEVIVALSIVFVLVLLSTFSYMSGTIRKSPDADHAVSPALPASVRITGSGGICHTFAVEIADEPEEQATGLMNRTSMAADSGMLFIFDNSDIRHFWMKNTPIALDMIFIDQDGKIVNIHENATPLSLREIRSEGPCKYVLEVNGGLCRSYNISAGDSVQIVEQSWPAG